MTVHSTTYSMLIQLIHPCASTALILKTGSAELSVLVLQSDGPHCGWGDAPALPTWFHAILGRAIIKVSSQRGCVTMLLRAVCSLISSRWSSGFIHHMHHTSASCDTIANELAWRH